MKIPHFPRVFCMARYRSMFLFPRNCKGALFALTDPPPADKALQEARWEAEVEEVRSAPFRRLPSLQFLSISKSIYISQCQLPCVGYGDRSGGGGYQGGGGGGGGAGACYAYQKGECNRGSGCRFSHDSGGGGGEA